MRKGTFASSSEVKRACHHENRRGRAVRNGNKHEKKLEGRATHIKLSFCLRKALTINGIDQEHDTVHSSSKIISPKLSR
jgi:hypothetical protein